MSNSLMAQQRDLLKQTLSLRDEMMSVLNDDDLQYSLPGNITMGELCLALGETQRHYIDGFTNFQHDCAFRHDDRTIATSVERLNAWYKELDEALFAALEALAEEDLQKMVDRGHGFILPVAVQYHVMREAFLIYYGKASLYLRALNKEIPATFGQWIG